MKNDIPQFTEDEIDELQSIYYRVGYERAIYEIFEFVASQGYSNTSSLMTNLRLEFVKKRIPSIQKEIEEKFPSSTLQDKLLSRIEHQEINKKKMIWLDDIRDPLEEHFQKNFSYLKEYSVIWLKNYEEFRIYLLNNKMPDAISFDHDLGDFKDDLEYTGYTCLKWLSNYILETSSSLPIVYFHSQNTVGKENMEKYWKNFLKHL